MQRYIYALWGKTLYFGYVDTKEYDLEQKIDLEIKMREGTTKLLAACRHPNQSLEAGKSLLTSNERMTAYMAELQRRKALERKHKDGHMRLEPSKGKMAVSDIRMPLIWKDTDHFKNKGNYRRFAIFCLLKVGTEIYDTVMINNVDRSMTDITFEDTIILNHIPPDFEFRLEVYSHVQQDDLSIASTPRKIKKKISNSVSRTIGRKLAASLKEELNALEIGPKFDLVAHATLRLCDTNDNIQTHDLVLENLENPHHQLPLFGHFCCRLAIQPECATEERLSGFLSVVQHAGSISACHRLWCCLKNFKLSFWNKPEESNAENPVLSIPLTEDSLQQENKIANYPHSFTVKSLVGKKTQEYILVSDSEYEWKKWTANIKQHSKDEVLWKHALENVMEIPFTPPCRVPVFIRHGSLYDETPFGDGLSSSSSFTSSILQENNHQLSPPFRSRSSSTSSAASSTGSSRPYFSLFRSRKAYKDVAFL